MEQIIDHDPVTGYPTYYLPNRYEFKNKIISGEYISPYDEDAEAYNTYRDRYSYICYKSTLPNEMSICMIPVATSSGKSIELYVVENDKLSPLCSSNYTAEEIRNNIEELYEAVAGHSNIELSKNLENKINSFLKEKK